MGGIFVLEKSRKNTLARRNFRFFYASHELDKIGEKFKELKIRNVLLPLYYDISRNESGEIDASCNKLPTVS